MRMVVWGVVVLVPSVVLVHIVKCVLAKRRSKVNSSKGETLGLGREENMVEISVAADAEPEASFSVKEPDVVLENDDFEDYDDFEGYDAHDDDVDIVEVEDSEHAKTFNAAIAFVSAAAAGCLSQNVSPKVKLQLYGLRKIATKGPCSCNKPKAQPYGVRTWARAKWNAWQRLGALQPEEAMRMYIDIADKQFPSWAAASTGDIEVMRNHQGQSKWRLMFSNLKKIGMWYELTL